MSAYPVFAIPFESKVNDVRITNVCLSPRAWIDSMEVAVVQLITGEWWITNEYDCENGQFESVGPFVRSDDAVLHHLLLATTIESI